MNFNVVFFSFRISKMETTIYIFNGCIINSYYYFILIMKNILGNIYYHIYEVLNTVIANAIFR